MVIGTSQRAVARGGIAMGLLDRVRNIVKANVNDALNRAEDPVKALDQMIASWSADLVKVRQAAALAIAAENRLQAEYDQRAQAVQDWQRRAALAVDRGDDNLARQALGRKLQYQNEANQLGESIQAQAGHLNDLRANVQDLENRVQQAVLQRNQLVARYRTAEATKSLEQELSRTGTGQSGRWSDFRRRPPTPKRRPRRIPSSAVIRSRTGSPQLEQGHTVEDELAALKEQRQLKPALKARR